ncbi:hypothetical protein FS749_000392 [Ceratobasidium sp. UAMH 11750]|nr:hypothetical protein FS749_000392 [Ceratobasidium sp. UAMH 11750]
MPRTRCPHICTEAALYAFGSNHIVVAAAACHAGYLRLQQTFRLMLFNFADYLLFPSSSALLLTCATQPPEESLATFNRSISAITTLFPTANTFTLRTSGIIFTIGVARSCMQSENSTITNNLLKQSNPELYWPGAPRPKRSPVGKYQANTVT